MDHNLYSIIPYKNKLIKLEQPIRARAFYLRHSIDLLTGERSECDIGELCSELRDIKICDDVINPRVIHLFYELGFMIEKGIADSETLLAIDCEFSKFSDVCIESFKAVSLEKIYSPEFSDYKKSFDQGYKELLKGNCYQFNLTFSYLYKFTEEYRPEDFIFSLWKNKHARGAYASATYVPYLQTLYLSNSPECLFVLNKNLLSAMPIKGTLKRDKHQRLKDQWKKLSTDKKSQAELYMISDLLRNDLSRIELPRAKIVKRKQPKVVPGLLHQYSQIDIELSSSVNLWRIIEKVFPGGSITGAPKQRAISLLQNLEQRERGFYCGSSLILYKNMKAASINIRSSEIKFKNNERTLRYQAGGGITLRSRAKEEFSEMTYKHDSFIGTLTV